MKRITLPLELTEEVSEILGRHCGDGSCSFGNFDYKVAITEHPSLIELHNRQLKMLFGLDTRNRIINNECIESVVRSKQLFEWITSFGIPSGKKSYIVKEPEKIRSASLQIRKAFLRGLIDTDGCIFYDAANRSLKLEFKTVSPYLASSVNEILSLLNFKPKLRKQKKGIIVGLKGKKVIENYLNVVGSNNLRLLNKAYIRLGKQVALAEKAVALRDIPLQGTRQSGPVSLL